MCCGTPLNDSLWLLWPGLRQRTTSNASNDCAVAFIFQNFSGFRCDSLTCVLVQSVSPSVHRCASIIPYVEKEVNTLKVNVIENTTKQLQLQHFVKHILR